LARRPKREGEKREEKKEERGKNYGFNMIDTA